MRTILITLLMVLPLTNLGQLSAQQKPSGCSIPDLLPRIRVPYPLVAAWFDLSMLALPFEQTIVLAKNGKRYELSPSGLAVNGKSHDWAIRPVTGWGTIYVPLTFFLKEFGANATYVDESATLTLAYADQKTHSARTTEQSTSARKAASSERLRMHADSPHGDLYSGWKALSRDGRRLAYDGHVFDYQTGWVLGDAAGGKGFAWHPDNCQYATMYHGWMPDGGAGEILIHRLTGEQRRYKLTEYYHSMRFADDAQSLLVGAWNIPEKAIPISEFQTVATKIKRQ